VKSSIFEAMDIDIIGDASDTELMIDPEEIEDNAII